MMEVGIFFGVLLAIVGSIAATKHIQSSTWQKVAQKLGLGFEDSTWFGHPKLYGKFRDTDVDVTIEVVGSGKSKQIYTVVEAPLSGLAPYGLKVYQEGMWEKMEKLIGGDDIQVGDPELDKAFIIQGNDAEKISEVLTAPSVKRSLIVGQRRHRTLRIDFPRVRLRQGGRTLSVSKLESYIRTVVDLAVCINEASGARPVEQSKKDALEPSIHHPEPPDSSGPPARFGPPAAGEPEPASSQTGSSEPVGAAEQDDANDWW
ncbi:hypothetical protein FIV42_26100 [Persicimonas caeni]|uniref:Uncharacterized protein n=1 Tax=Persicimonas caeni TaxID=2292766 RepID=A0A4Y6Q1N0_PERCE|nr:hypothetical protein [Persicimonas caeni]QDG54087.1 hypothetical protein FIV42_26100 [Persicimonas caeni]QED35308.1 hypothetical protein FRD00_26095 [Persicimonas caeni]